MGGGGAGGWGGGAGGQWRRGGSLRGVKIFECTDCAGYLHLH